MRLELKLREWLLPGGWTFFDLPRSKEKIQTTECTGITERFQLVSVIPVLCGKYLFIFFHRTLLRGLFRRLDSELPQMIVHMAVNEHTIVAA